MVKIYQNQAQASEILVSITVTNRVFSIICRMGKADNLKANR
jgi:hypothetical protein